MTAFTSYGAGFYGAGFYSPWATIINSAVTPELSVEIDFTNDPTDTTRVWTVVTPDVRQLAYTLDGRSDALQRTSTGTLSMLLDNRSGDYDPTNAAGAYYPGVKRLRWIRVRARWNGVEYPRWQGVVEAWNQEWPEAGKDAVVVVQAATALKILALYDLGGKDYAAGLTSARVTSVCADAGISSSVSTGASAIVDSGTISNGTQALSHLQDVEDTENGRLFSNAGGTVVFQDRHYRLLHSSASSGTIGDVAGEIPYRESGASLVSDDSNIWNRAVVTPSGGTAETATVSTSQTSYFQRTITRDILSSSQTEALSAAQYLAGLYGDPAPKLPKLTLIPAKAPTLWPTVLGLTNSNRVTFKRRAAATITSDGFVEQISERIIPGSMWDVDVQLSAVTDQQGWILGDSVYGLLGQTTTLVY